MGLFEIHTSLNMGEGHLSHKENRLRREGRIPFNTDES